MRVRAGSKGRLGLVRVFLYSPAPPTVYLSRGPAWRCLRSRPSSCCAIILSLADGLPEAPSEEPELLVRFTVRVRA